jgi:hypothetical protein
MRISTPLFACGIAMGCLGLGCLSLDPLASYSDRAGSGGSAALQSETQSETPDTPATDGPPAVGSSAGPDAGSLPSEGEPNVDSSGLGAGGALGSEADAGASSVPDAGAAPCSGAGEFPGPGTTSCYRLVMVAANWNDASLDCQNWGGGLVQVDSRAEDTLLAGRVLVQIWIGASDQAVEGRQVWSGGAPLVYTNWAPGQPDDYLGIEDCTVKQRPQGNWNDVPCSDLNAYVCERSTL